MAFCDGSWNFTPEVSKSNTLFFGQHYKSKHWFRKSKLSYFCKILQMQKLRNEIVMEEIVSVGTLNTAFFESHGLLILSQTHEGSSQHDLLTL